MKSRAGGDALQVAGERPEGEDGREQNERAARDVGSPEPLDREERPRPESR